MLKCQLSMNVGPRVLDKPPHNQGRHSFQYFINMQVELDEAESQNESTKEKAKKDIDEAKSTISQLKEERQQMKVHRSKEGSITIYLQVGKEVAAQQCQWVWWSVHIAGFRPLGHEVQTDCYTFNGGGGGIQIWFGWGCATQALKPLPIICKSHFGRKSTHF